MKLLKALPLTTAAIVWISAASAFAATSSADFVTKASEANQFEIDSSKLALQKSGNQNVKQFAQQMIDDHTKAGAGLEKALDASHADAEMASGLDSKDKKTMETLNGDSGADFDKDYIKAQTKAHKKAVSLFKDYSTHGDDSSLKAFAVQTLPVLEGHLSHVKQLKSQM